MGSIGRVRSPSGLFLRSAVRRSGGLLESLRGGTESIDSHIGVESQSKGRHLFVLPFLSVRRELEALKLERNPQDQVMYFIIFILYSELPSSQSKNRNHLSISSIFFIGTVERALVWDLPGLASVRSSKRENIFCACDGRDTKMVGSCSFGLSQGGRHTSL